MAKYTVPGLLAGALGDVFGSPVQGVLQGELAAPQVQGAYQNIRLNERDQFLREQLAAQQMQAFPLRQQFMQAEIARMTRPEMIQTPYGAYEYTPGQAPKEVPIPRPQFDTSTPGWVKRTDPNGLVQWQRATMTPDAADAAQAELKTIGPTDIGKMLMWANKYPELSGGVEKYMDMYRKSQDSAGLARYRDRIAAAAETRARADQIRAGRGPAGQQPHWSQTQTAAKPMSPLEANRYQPDVDSAVKMLSADPDFATPGRLTASGLPKDKIIARLVSEMLGGNVDFDVAWDPSASPMQGTPSAGYFKGAPQGRFVIRGARHAGQVLERSYGVGLPPGAQPSASDTTTDDAELLQLLQLGSGGGSASE